MTIRTVAIIQARMASSRLPGKVLVDLAGTPMLGRVVERTRQARSTDAVVVATTNEPSDDPIVEYCKASRIDVVRGSHFDVLDRYYAAAQAVQSGIVIRITADCPLIDPGLIDDTVAALLGKAGAGVGSSGAQAAAFDFAANRLPPPWKRTYPIGLDTEACTMAALAQAWRDAQDPVEREHVMPFLYDGVQVHEAKPPLVRSLLAVLPSDLILLVTEPTPFGFHDFRLAHAAFAPLGKPMAVVINRAGLGDRSVQEFCRSQQLPILAEIPFDRRLAEAYSQGQVLADALPNMRTVFEELMGSLRGWAETAWQRKVPAHA